MQSSGKFLRKSIISQYFNKILFWHTCCHKYRQLDPTFCMCRYFNAIIWQGRIVNGGQVIKVTEKMQNRHHDCDARIEWTQFDRTAYNYGLEIFYQARVLNFSKSGLYFETRCSLKPGMTVLFRIEPSDWVTVSEEGYESLRTISLVEI